MKKFFFVIVICLLGCYFVQAQNSYQDLYKHFYSPNDRYGVGCWWWWLNGNVDKQAIAKDLKAMKEKGFYGAMIFDAGGYNQRGNRDVPAGPEFGSGEWKELFLFAMDEAERQGLEMGFNIQSGWNLGGPRVSLEHAAKKLTFSQFETEGGKTIRESLPKPPENGFYKDIAVIAIPLLRKSDNGISDLRLKAAFHEYGLSASDCSFLLWNDAKQQEPAYCVSRNELVFLTDRMDEDGFLEWKVPEGKWVILRAGYTYTGARVSTSSNTWKGPVLDYMSEEAFDSYWDREIVPILKYVGKHVGKTLKYMETDSWECGGMNWTDRFPEEFKMYCGYDVLPYLPVIAGFVVEDTDHSNAFLADFRKTIAHLIAVRHYARFAEKAHQYGLGIQPESAGPHNAPLDGIKNYGFSDLVMSEFWAPSPHRPNPQNRFFVKQASSAAHIYGKKIVGAESFTTIGPHWNDELWREQKPSFDHEICAGLNRTYFHTFTCSPPSQGLPGQEYFAGTHVNPQVTWWKYADPFIDYMHRVQYVVQNGKFAADVLYYYGDHVPNILPYKHADPSGAMFGFDFDAADETTFLRLQMKDGRLYVPGGVSYRLLVLPKNKVLSYNVLMKLDSLLQEGACVLGDKPLKAVSLCGGMEAARHYQILADRIWGPSVGEKGSRNYGKGRICWGYTSKELLLLQGFVPDFEVKGNDSKTDFEFIHYLVGGTDVYFVSNQTASRQDIEAVFRVSGKQPEIWNPLDGSVSETQTFVQRDGRTGVFLQLEAYQSLFVVFHRSISTRRQGSAEPRRQVYEKVMSLDKDWTVHFDSEWGAPAAVHFPELMDWTLHENTGIRYYSGTGVYNRNFYLEEKDRKSAYFLDLGTVKDVGIATVKINGVDKGIFWTHPFRMDITDALLKGDNAIEITVTNSWYNRVAGDDMKVSRKRYTKTNILLLNDYRGKGVSKVELEPSGLIGPVILYKASGR